MRGTTYVAWDAHYKDLSQRITSLMDSGYKCCLFTKDAPGSLSAHQNLKVIRVSDDRADDSIPLSPEHIMGKFEDFIDANGQKAVVVLDVFDNLLDSQDTKFTTAYLLLNRMMDVTAINKNILFVPISTESLNEMEKALIKNTGVNVLRAAGGKRVMKGFFGKRRSQQE